MTDEHQTCVECDAEGPTTDQGLCSDCRADLRFIVRPAAHREHLRRSDATDPAIKELERQGFVLIDIASPDNSFWVCDFCNTQIPADDDITLIPLLASYALCPPCVSKIPFWPEGWTQPSPLACECDACQLPLARAQFRIQQARSPRVEEWGIGL